MAFLAALGLAFLAGGVISAAAIGAALLYSDRLPRL